MPNIQMLNLADVYAKADAAKAAQQQATLRDLQIGTAQRQQQQEMGLSEIAQQSRNPETGEIDPDIMAAGAAARGYHEPALKYQGMATDAKTKKQALVKSRTDFMGQIAYVNDQETLDEFHERFREFDPKAAAVFKEQYSVYNPEAIGAIKQRAMQGMSSYQRESLAAQERIAKQKADKETDYMKAADSNAIKGTVASILNIPFTTNPVTGDVQLGKLNPGQQQQLMAMTELAAKIRKKTGMPHSQAVNEAARRLRSVMPEIPAIPDYSNLLEGQPSGPPLPSPTVGPNRGPVPIRSQAEWDALPSGSKYLRSDGKVATKP